MVAISCLAGHPSDAISTSYDLGPQLVGALILVAWGCLAKMTQAWVAGTICHPAWKIAGCISGLICNLLFAPASIIVLPCTLLAIALMFSTAD